MNRLLILLSLTFALVTADPAWLEDHAANCSDDRELYEAFLREFRGGASPIVMNNENGDSRFQKFLKNKQLIEENRRKKALGLETYEMDVNKFADIDDDDFIPTHCGIRPELAPPTPSVRTVEYPETRQFVPPTWDIRTLGPGCLTDVKDQGDCGSCWAFAASGALENYYCQRSPFTRQCECSISMSNQQQLDCNTRTYGCDGGWFTTAFDYTKSRGLALDSAYPYLEVKRTCRDSVVRRPYVHANYVQLASDVNTIRTHIRTRGACAACVDANRWKLYSSGIFNGAGLSPQCNHAIVLIGYGPDYWLIKNSWGSDWGEDGYIKVSTAKTGGFFPQYVYCPVK